MALDLMRADIRVRDTFHHIDGRVTVPLQVLTGRNDTVIAPDSALQWRAMAGASYQHTVLPGGHFYTPEIWRTLPNYLRGLTEPPVHSKANRCRPDLCAD